MKKYHWVKVTISPEILLEMITQGWSGDGVRCIEGCPEGARVVCVRSVGYPRCIELIIEHASFAATDGKRKNLPDIKPIFMRKTGIKYGQD